MQNRLARKAAINEPAKSAASRSASKIEELAHRLVAQLQCELQEYGETLALLDGQQQQIVFQSPAGVWTSVAEINAQMARLADVRGRRETTQGEIARLFNLNEQSTIKTLLPLMPQKFHSAMEALVGENNELLGRIQRRTQQNQTLLSKSLQMIQGVMKDLSGRTLNCQ